MRTPNYDMNPEALRTIETKLKQMQATGANITPDMMRSLYESVLEVGADKAARLSEIEANMKNAAANRASTDRRFDKAAKIRQDEGLGNTIGNATLYGMKYADKEGLLDPLKFWKDKPPGSATGEVTTTPTGMSTNVLPGPVTTPPTEAGIIGEPISSMFTGGTPVGEVGTKLLPTAMKPGVPAPAGATTGFEMPLGLPTPPGFETLSELAPPGYAAATESMVPSTITDLAAPGLEAGMETGANAATEGIATAAPSLGLSAISTPFAAGGLAGGIMKATGVSDDVGKVILFGQGGKNEQDIAGGVAGGAAAGAAMGSVVPVVGTAVGAIVGGIAGGLSNADICVIVTCCHGRHSPEVQIAREYRDTYMSQGQIRGYYVLAEMIVPRMIRHNLFRDSVKRNLVDRLIRHGKWALGKTEEKPGILDYVVTKSFLGACSIAGILVPEFRRCSGEVC
jgi:hypothetical protein